MSQELLTEAIQHYLREIYKLGQGRTPVAVGELARAQGVSAASASAMVKKLAVHVDDVHDEADRLEHAISEELEARIDRALGFPTHDPHGDPIPDANLEWPSGRRRNVPKERAARRGGTA